MTQYRKTPRANFIDYDAGDYFVTICTKDREHYFGMITDGVMRLSLIGNYVENQLKQAHELCHTVNVPLYVIMPNHIHAIISITENEPVTHDVIDINQRNPNPSLRANLLSQRHVTTLSKYITSLKESVTKFAKSMNLNFGWQPRYHDHLIRGTRDGNSISEYIMNNVVKWSEDRYNPETVTNNPE